MCGLVSIASQRLLRLTINKHERNKLLKEIAIANVLARHGFRVHLVEEDPRTRSYDALINGVPADFKRTSSHNNIRKYASLVYSHKIGQPHICGAERLVRLQAEKPGDIPNS